MDTCQYQTVLHAKPPRTACGEHAVRVVKLPWAEPSSRFAALFERLAMDGLKAASQKTVGEHLGLSWEEIHGIMGRAVERGLERRQAEQVASIQAVAMDMWDPYVSSTREHLPKANGKIVFDKFHIAKHLGEAVERVRRRENKTLRAAGDDRLAGTRYDWLRHPAAREPKDRQEFAVLRNSNLKTARAWALKETGMALFDYHYERPARKHFRWWHGWAVRSRLGPMIEVARLLKRRLENILTYLRHRITNAASESINSKIQCGGLETAPSCN